MLGVFDQVLYIAESLVLSVLHSGSKILYVRLQVLHLRLVQFDRIVHLVLQTLQLAPIQIAREIKSNVRQRVRPDSGTCLRVDCPGNWRTRAGSAAKTCTHVSETVMHLARW